MTDSKGTVTTTDTPVEVESNSAADVGNYGFHSPAREDEMAPVLDAVDTGSGIALNEGYVEQVQLSLTPSLLRLVDSHHQSSEEAKLPALTSSLPKREKPVDPTHFVIYEDPEEPESVMEMDTTDALMDIDYDDNVLDFIEDPQQWDSYGHFSDDKENAYTGYDDGDDEASVQLQPAPHSQQINFDEVETESDTETTIQEHALARYVPRITTPIIPGIEEEIRIIEGEGSECDDDIVDHVENDQLLLPARRQDRPLPSLLGIDDDDDGSRLNNDANEDKVSHNDPDLDVSMARIHPQTEIPSWTGTPPDPRQGISGPSTYVHQRRRGHQPRAFI